MYRPLMWNYSGTFWHLSTLILSSNEVKLKYVHLSESNHCFDLFCIVLPCQFKGPQGFSAKSPLWMSSGTCVFRVVPWLRLLDEMPQDVQQGAELTGHPGLSSKKLIANRSCCEGHSDTSCKGQCLLGEHDISACQGVEAKIWYFQSKAANLTTFSLTACFSRSPLVSMKFIEILQIDLCIFSQCALREATLELRAAQEEAKVAAEEARKMKTHATEVPWLFRKISRPSWLMVVNNWCHFVQGWGSWILLFCSHVPPQLSLTSVACRILVFQSNDYVFSLFFTGSTCSCKDSWKDSCTIFHLVGPTLLHTSSRAMNRI